MHSLGLYITIREWEGLILEFCQGRRRREVIRRPLLEEDNRTRIQLPTMRPRNVIYTHPHYPNVHLRTDCPVFQEVHDVCDICDRMRESPRTPESTLRRRREQYRHAELGEVSDPELWTQLHHHSSPDSLTSSDRELKGKGMGKGLRAKAKSKAKAKPFPRDQGGLPRQSQTAESSGIAGSSTQAVPGREPEPEQAAPGSGERPVLSYDAQRAGRFQKRAEEQFFGVDRLGEEPEHTESGHS